MSDDINEMQHEFEKALRDMEQVFEIHGHMQNAGESGFNMDLAMEADSVATKQSILSTYMSTASKQQKYKLATESIRDKLVETIVAVYEKIVETIKKFISFLMKPFKGQKDPIEKVEVVSAISKDTQLLKAMDNIDGFVADAQRVATEDMLSPSKLTNISINDIYEKFVETLADPEVDFLTSGHRYKTIKDVVDKFSKGHFPEFISDMSGSIQKWVDESLTEAPHIGKSEDSVRKFMASREVLINTILKNHKDTIDAVHELEKSCGITPSKDIDRKRLHVFLKTPSMLFPHIERMLESVRFERITDTDKRMIGSLEKVRQRFEHDVRLIQNKLSSENINWPAQEAVLKSAQKINRETLEHIGALIKVSNFIKHSAEVAFHTTSKAFSYIIGILREVQRIPNIDKEKVKECIDIVQTNRRKLDSLTSFS